MTKENLLIKAKELNIPESFFSIDGKLIASGMMMEKYGEDKWQVYHLDDHGKHENEQIFFSKERAYDYLYELLKEMAVFFRK